MDDPDLYELEEATGIGIFEPGTHLESGIDKNQMIGVLGYTALGMVLLVIATVAIMIPLLMTPLIVIDFYSYSIYIDPLAMLIMTVAEIGFVIPPMYYIRKRGLPKSAIGIKNMLSGKDMLLGVFIGLLMIGANFVISWIVTTTTGPPDPGAQDILVARNLAEMIAWTLAMFVFVGFTEELLFRGFMQRRMEMYFRGRGTVNYKIFALLISSFIFGVIHFDLVGLPARFVLGIFLGDLAQRRNYNILGPSIAHGMNNAIVVILSSLGF